MKVLIADDDPSVRLALNRLLVKEFDCGVVEADGGLAALDRLTTARFSLVLLDLDMPTLSGLEVLQSIRNSPEHHQLPVIVISGMNAEDTVRQVIRLGIADYLAKPLKAEKVVTRVKRVLQALDSGNRHSDASHGTLPTLSETTPLLLVDSDPEFRHFLASLLGPRCPVLSMAHGVEALSACAAASPAAVLVGANTGLLGPALLARKLRENHALAATRIVAVVPRSDIEATQGTGLYDAVLARTFVPEIFERQLRTLTEAKTGIRNLLQAYPTFRVHIIAATEQAFGMMADCEVSQVDILPTESASTGDACEAQVVMTMESLDLQVEFLLRCSDVVARSVAARLTGTHTSELTTEDLGSALGELANVISGRLQKGAVDHDITARCSIPKTASVSARESADLMLHFVSADAAIRFDVAVNVASIEGHAHN